MTSVPNDNAVPTDAAVPADAAAPDWAAPLADDSEPVEFSYVEMTRPRASRSLRELPRLVLDAVRLVRSAAPRELTVSVVLSVLSAVLVAAQLLVARALLAKISDVRDRSNLGSLVPTLVAFVVVFTGLGVVGVLQSERRRVLAELVTRAAERTVADAATRASLLDFESPAFHNRLKRALVNASFRPVTLTFALIGLISGLLTLFGVMIAILVIEPLLLLLVVIAIGPAWIGTKRMTRLGYQFDVAETENDRRRGYFLHLLTDKAAAREVRAYELADEFQQQHRTLWTERIGRVRALAKRRTRIAVTSRLLNAALIGAVLVVLVWFVSDGRITVTNATILAGAIVVLGQRLNSVIGSIGELYESALFLGDVQAFIAAIPPHDERQPATAGFEEIVVDDVSFRYPSSERLALDGVSMRIKRGEVVALVGANGSGKTTLAKIIGQLYPITSGTVSWNGAPVIGGPIGGLRRNIAMIFQDFEKYHFTVRENIGFGDVRRPATDHEVLDAAMRSGSLDFIERLPEGLEALLGPEYIGGSDLSTGQWQRLALARSIFRDAPLIILDEPSSALDAEAEAELFDRLRTLGEGRGVLVISHRFSTVTSADRIYVLDHGRVIEQGSHRELIARDGTYARLFRLQASRYEST
ncbi:MAG: transporter related [Ilumatobacteraceae bacterium]|nr:transporter related [Ilumatobacteraceae bacterium]